MKDLMAYDEPSALAVKGLAQPHRWSLYGVGFGVSATAAVTLLPALAAPTAGAAAVLMSGMVSAGVVGAYVGRRWHRLVARERGRLSIAQLMYRFAGYGAAWGAAAAMGVVLPLAFTAPQLGGFVLVAGIVSAIGGAAGAVVTGLLGVQHVLDLTRGHHPWKTLALASVLGPTALFGVFILLHMIAHIIGIA